MRVVSSASRGRSATLLLVADIELEVNLRIPNAKTRIRDEQGYPIDHTSVRFIKRLIFASIPKQGTVIPLATAAGTFLRAEVLGTEWSEQRSVLILYCRYAGRSISVDEITALVADPSWTMRPLL
jgi:hypothetical protein